MKVSTSVVVFGKTSTFEGSGFTSVETVHPAVFEHPFLIVTT